MSDGLGVWGFLVLIALFGCCNELDTIGKKLDALPRCECKP